MTLYMLDTNIASAAVRGDAALDGRLLTLEPEQWCISAVTQSELRYGVALRPEAVRLEYVVESFLTVATVMPWTAAAGSTHGRLRAALKQQGTSIAVFDEMLAGHALALGAVLVTDNTRLFDQVPGLVVENWLLSATGH